MRAKLTKNKSSVQLIIPAEARKEYRLEPGRHVELVPHEEGLLIRPGPTPRISTEVWTIGYEGTTVESLINTLRGRKVRQLIDVREVPLSRKKGFSKTALGEKLEENGITYRHIPELGSPSDARHTYKGGGSMKTFMDHYESHLSANKKAFDMLRGLIMATPSAIMCYEKDHWGCHRRILADRLEDLGFRVQHA